MPAGAHPGCASPSCRQNTPALPSGPGLAASLPIMEPSPGGRGTHSPPLPARHAIQTGRTPSALSSSPAPVGAAPGTTRSARTGRDCLATEHRGASAPCLLGPHSPSAGFESPGCLHPGTGHHPGARRGSRVSDGLRSTVHVGSRCDPARLSPLVRSSRSAKISAPVVGRDFPTQKPEAGGYQIGDGVSRFGSVSS